MAFLDIVNATKTYGTVEVLHDISLSVEQGELIVLVGPSGCGKSTLLNMIAGLEEVSSGEIHINGRLVNGVHPSRRNIAMVFQSYALYPNMTVAQNITFGLEMHGVPKPERNRALADVAKLLQIEPLLKRRPSQLSGGQRQRVAMGRALVREPDVFLFDEPLSNLDAKLRVDMRTEIKKLHQELGATMIYVTHDQIEALTLSTRIAVMNRGYLQQVGTSQDIYESPANLFVAGFMGSPSMNLIEAGLIEDNGSAIATVKNADGNPCKLKLSQSVDSLRAHVGRDIILGVRPETMTDIEGADRNAGNIQQIRNRVSVIEPAGSDTFVTSVLSGKDCTSRMRVDAPVRLGEDFEFAINMDKAVIFDPESGDRIS